MSMNASESARIALATLRATVDLPEPEPPAIPMIRGFIAETSRARRDGVNAGAPPVHSTVSRALLPPSSRAQRGICFSWDPPLAFAHAELDVTGRRDGSRLRERAAVRSPCGFERAGRRARLG